MPELELLTTTITPVAQPVAHVLTYMDVTGPAAFTSTLNINTSVANAGKAPTTRAGVTVYVDLGSGVLSAIPMADLGASFSIQESLEGGNYSDVLTFSRVGKEWSPFFQRLIGSRRAVAVDFTYGAPGYETTQRVFTGFFTESTFEGNPPVATITALDDAIKYSELTLSIHEDPGHGKTRMQILEQVAAAYVIPLGDVDLGPNGNTVCVKPIDEAESTPISWLANYLSPCGVQLYFSGGKLNVIRHSTNPASRRLTAADLVGGSFNVKMPAVAEANEVTAVAVKFTTTFANGFRTEVQIVSTFGDYSIQSWTSSQASGASGAITGGGPGAGSVAYREIGRVTTTSTFYGATPIEQVIEEKGWYAAFAARRNINTTTGVITYNSAWLFPDGSWRAALAETFQTIIKTHTVSTYDVDLRINKIDSYQYRFSNPERGIWVIASGVDSPVGGAASAVPIDEDGFGRERDGEILGTNQPDNATPAYASAFNRLARTIQIRDVQTDGSVPLDTYNIYGLDAGLITSDADGAYVYDTDRTIFRTAAAESYKQIQTRSITSAMVGQDRVTTTESVIPGTTTVTTQYGTLPYADTIQAESTSQELRHTATDEVRSVLNGVKVEPIHNEWCENEAELVTVALTRLRELGAWSVPWTMPIEGILHKGKWVAVHVPEIGCIEEDMLITGLTRDFSSFTQSMSLKYYPPELVS